MLNKSLFEYSIGDSIMISTVQVEGTLRRRLLDLGFVPGAIVEVSKKSPLGDPIAYRVAGTVIALRKEETQAIYGELVQDER